MEVRKRKRCIYVTARQKKKLIELMSQHPELVSCKITHDFNYKDSQRMWQNIANECNAIQGARKTWRQWRKTWHDLRSKTKKRHAETNGEFPVSAVILTPAEQEALGIKSLTNSEYQETTEFVPLEESCQDDFSEEAPICSSPDPPEPPETKVFDSSHLQGNSKMPNHSSKHKCYLGVNFLALQEKKKIEMKEEYLNFKKEYLRQKLKLMKIQTEALASIAKELSQ